MTGLSPVRRAALVAGLAAAAAGGALAQDAGAAFYKGKTVRFTVGLGVGGGFDAYARMIAPYLSKELDSTVIVENLPGAGGLLALNQIATGPADGLRVLIVNGTPAALGQLLDQDNIRYDLTKVDHLGVISAYPWIWLMSPKSDVKTVAEALKPGVKIRWGGTGPSDGPADEWIIKYAKQNLLCVATNDVPMRKRLLALELPVIAMKSKSKLDFV